MASNNGNMAILQFGAFTPATAKILLEAINANSSGIKRLTVTGDIDGINRVFTVSPAAVTLMWFWNGMLQSEPDDYTYLNGIVTMAIAPIAPQKVAAYGG